jgi:carboxypeptidase Q
LTPPALTRLSVLSLVAVAAGCFASIRRAPPVATARVTAPSGASKDTSVRQLDVPVSADSEVVAALVRQGMRHSRVESDLEYLSDVIGPRLTGSEAASRANDWTLRKFEEYRVDSAWTESWHFGRGWERGPIALTLLSPHTRQLIGASWAWAPGTNGPETGAVIYMSAQSKDEYSHQFAGAVRGKWVMTRTPTPVWNTDGPPMTAADSAAADSARKIAVAQYRDPAVQQYRQQLPATLAQDGALGVVVDGAKEFTLLTMSGSPAQPLPLPYIVLPHETFAQFHRLIALGDTVRLRADISNTLTSQDVDAANTVAEIRGTAHPDEVVLVGAHLDSWDLGDGATDNGTGAIAVLEAARILAAAPVKPQRSIRFALFTGEEEGLFGSQRYAERHASELPKYQAVLVLDNGTGRVTGMSLQGRNDLHDLWQSLFAPISSLGPFAIQARDKGGTDHLSFIPFGVPSFNYDQLTRGYNHTHHSQADTFDHAVIGDVQQCATVMAVTAYELANLPELLPRPAAAPQAQAK